MIGLFLVLLVWVSQTVRSTKISYQIQKLEDEIRKEERIKAELEVRKNKRLSLNAVEEYAGKNLGLINPQEKDVIIIRK